MERRRRFSPTLTTLLFAISITAVLQLSTCCKPQNTKEAGSSRLEKRGLFRQLSTNKPPDTKIARLATTGTSNASNSSNATADGRPKRQLFRGDIPHHRPLTGNTFAVYSSRWLPVQGGGESRGLEAVSSPIYIPNIDAISEVPPPARLAGGAGAPPRPPYPPPHSPSSYQVIHSNEIVHEYPVEVSPVISLHPQAGHHHHARLPPPHGSPHAHGHARGYAHAPPKVHPDQDPERLKSIGKSNPNAPADLVIKELNGEPGPTGELVKILNSNSNEHGSSAYEEDETKGGNFESWGSQDYVYRGKPLAYYGPPYQTGAQKVAHFFKNWPWLLKSKLFPTRRYHRKRAQYHYKR